MKKWIVKIRFWAIWVCALAFFVTAFHVFDIKDRVNLCVLQMGIVTLEVGGLIYSLSYLGVGRLVCSLGLVIVLISIGLGMLSVVLTLTLSGAELGGPMPRGMGLF